MTFCTATTHLNSGAVALLLLRVRLCARSVSAVLSELRLLPEVKRLLLFAVR